MGKMLSPGKCFALSDYPPTLPTPPHPHPLAKSWIYSFPTDSKHAILLYVKNKIVNTVGSKGYWFETLSPVETICTHLIHKHYILVFIESFNFEDTF